MGTHCPDVESQSKCDWMADELHPTADGYYQIAKLVAEHLLFDKLLSKAPAALSEQVSR